MVGAQESPKTVSPEAADLLERIREHYRSQNKASAASNYVRHLRSFFSWAESNGHTLHTLPDDAVEQFLRSTGQKETTTYVMRTQIKSALRAAHNDLGVDFAHLQYESGKPREVRAVQKAKEKEKRQELKVAKAAATLNLPFIPSPAIQPPTPLPEDAEMAVEAYPAEPPASPPAPPASQVPSPTGASQPQIVVVPMPQQQAQKPQQNQQQRPMGTIGGGTPQRGITINNHTFQGSHIRVSRVADGSDPFVPMGTETYVTTLMASQLAPHGDVAAYMQQFIIPKLRLSPNTSQVPFVFHELNDRKLPTGRRDELVVSVPLSMASEGAAPVAPAFHGMPTPPAPTQFDPATQFMLKKLDDDKAAAERREERLAEELKQAKDSQMQLFLMQQMQREQELKQQLDERKMMEMARAQQIASMPPPTPVVVPDVPRVDPALELAKVREEANARLLEAVLVKAMQPPPPPPPPPPQKDVTEWLIPLMTQMNQQMQAQQQANQQMMMQMMQANQQFIHSTMTAQLQEAKAQANAPKEDDLEAFADKFQKFKMLTEMMPGGGGGEKSGGLIEALVSNFDTIGAGIAKVMSSRGAASTPVAPPMNGMAEAPRQLPPPQMTPGTSPTPQVDLKPTYAALMEAAQLADEEGRSKEVVDKIVLMINTYASMPEPAANMGRRIVTAFGQVEDEDDLFALTKHFWVAIGMKPDKPAAKAIAKALFAWFPILHRNMFGEPRFLTGQDATTYVPPSEVAPEGEIQVAPEVEEEEEGEEGEDSDIDGDSEDDVGESVEDDANNTVEATVGA